MKTGLFIPTDIHDRFYMCNG